MGVLSREELMNLIRSHVGDDNSETAIAFLENVTDTFEDLEQRATLAEDTVPKSELDKANETWAKKYKDRFFNPDQPDPPAPKPNKNIKPDVSINDLFK